MSVIFAACSFAGQIGHHFRENSKAIETMGFWFFKKACGAGHGILKRIM
jgi:hypothetical protein